MALWAWDLVAPLAPDPVAPWAWDLVVLWACGSDPVGLWICGSVGLNACGYVGLRLWVCGFGSLGVWPCYSAGFTGQRPYDPVALKSVCFFGHVHCLSRLANLQ